MGGEWKWNYWEDIDNGEEVESPPETDRHDSQHSFKSGFGNRFKLFSSVS